MEKSLFQQYVVRFFVGVALKLTNLINGKEMEDMYLFKTMLRPKFSPTLKWNTLTVKGRVVMADVVALDSPFPLKKRGSISRAEGDIPKIATKRYLNETQMTDIMVLESMPGDNSLPIAKILFEDATACTKGVWERLEYQFLQALSSGVFSVANETEDENGNRLTNVGIEFRVDLMHPDENKYGASVAWSLTDATPVDDIERITSAAKKRGHSLKNIYMDTPTWNKFKKNSQVRSYLAGSMGYTGQNLPIPTLAQINEYLSSEYRVSIMIIDRSVIAERDGVDKHLNAWTENAVVFTTGTIVGDYVYGQLAAERFPNKNIDYAKVDGYMLLSKYQKMGDTPIEYTTAQARILPVVDMSDIYILNSEEAQDTSADIQTEGDDTITLYGETTVSRANVINALKELGVNANANMLDTTLVRKVNELSDAEETAFKIAIEIPIVDAGNDQNVSEDNATLTGTVEAASGKTITSTTWSKVSGPAGGDIASANSLSTAITSLQNGTYVYKLTATDSAGTVASDTVSIVVSI